MALLLRVELSELWVASEYSETVRLLLTYSLAAYRELFTYFPESETVKIFCLYNASVRLGKLVHKFSYCFSLGISLSFLNKVK